MAELTSEINIKQKLIEELEMNHRRIEVLRHQYEEKLVQLESKIKDTERERDQVLASLSKCIRMEDFKNFKWCEQCVTQPGFQSSVLW